MIELILWWKALTLLFGLLGTLISLAPIFIGLAILAKTANGIIAIASKKLESSD